MLVLLQQFLHVLERQYLSDWVYAGKKIPLYIEKEMKLDVEVFLTGVQTLKKKNKKY